MQNNIPPIIEVKLAMKDKKEDIALESMGLSLPKDNLHFFIHFIHNQCRENSSRSLKIRL